MFEYYSYSYFCVQAHGCLLGAAVACALGCIGAVPVFWSLLCLLGGFVAVCTGYRVSSAFDFGDLLLLTSAGSVTLVLSVCLSQCRLWSFTDDGPFSSL